MKTLRVLTRQLCWAVVICASVNAQTTNPFDRPKAGSDSKPADSQTSAPASRPKQGGAVAKPTPPKPARVETDPKAVEIVDRYIESIGGRETLLAIKDRREELLNLKFSPTDVVELKINRLMKRPLMLREDWALDVKMPGTDQKLTIAQTFDGQKGWTKIMGVVEEMVGQSLTNFTWDKPIDNFFMNWRADGYRLLLGPEGEVGGVPADCVITVPFVGNQRISYFFSKDTGRLVKREWVDMSQRRPIRKEEFYDEYTEIPVKGTDGRVAVPLVRKTFDDGELSIEQQYESIRFNTDIDDSAFTKPQGKGFGEHKRDMDGKRDSGEEESAASKPSKPEPSTSKPKSATSRPSGY